ncbi:MAG: FMN-binding protein [Spirochaetaceae bacterium]|jgi:electron transport complex protein RnfG|nr:FMN-binding protein [Spirochaetaceae bacterium]
MKNILKLGLIMTLYAVAACVGLAFVYSATAKIIAERQQADLEAALKELFPDLEGYEDISGELVSPDGAVAFEGQYGIRRGNAFIGAAIRASGASYGGKVVILVGVGIDGKISGVKILEIADTPGLGANAASPTYYVDRARKITFYGQFTGKSVADPFTVKEDVAAVTASTITSRAITAAVRSSSAAAAAWLAAHTGVEGGTP